LLRVEQRVGLALGLHLLGRAEVRFLRFCGQGLSEIER